MHIDFGELDVNLKLASLLIGLSTNKDTKKEISAYLRGKPDENGVQKIFTEKIDNWRDFTDFLTNIDGRSMHCMNKIGKMLDSNSWKKIHYNPISILSKYKREREDLYFGKMFQNISLKDEFAAKKKLREALRGNLANNLIR